MELLNTFLFRKHGVPVLNVNSAHSMAPHQPSLEMDQIKRSLDAALAQTPETLNKDECDGDVDLDATLIVVKEEPSSAEEDTLLVDPEEPDDKSDERTDSVEGNATTLVNEHSGLDIATPDVDVSLPGPSNDALTMASALLSVQDRHVTQKIATRGKRSELAKWTSIVKVTARKKNTSTVSLPVSGSRVKQPKARAKRNRPGAVSRNGGRNKKHECSFCNKAFEFTSEKKRHELTHTGEKPFKCDVCGASFRRLPHHTAHMRTHTREKPFKCNFCPKVFTQQGSKIIHERCHTDEKPYTCEICGISFSQLAHKKDHMRTHTREKPFQCEECGKTFAKNSDKRMHMRVHNGDKPFHCQYCDKSFSQSSTLSRHIRIHTNEKPYSCLVCAKCFNVSSNLRKHEKTHCK